MIRIATAPVSPSRSYQYDTLGRPTSRTLARQGATRNDVFTYNDRSELISDVVDGTGLNRMGLRPRRRAAAASSSGVASRCKQLWRGKPPRPYHQGRQQRERGMYLRLQFNLCIRLHPSALRTVMELLTIMCLSR